MALWNRGANSLRNILDTKSSFKYLEKNNNKNVIYLKFGSNNNTLINQIESKILLNRAKTTLTSNETKSETFSSLLSKNPKLFQTPLESKVFSETFRRFTSSTENNKNEDTKQEQQTTKKTTSFTSNQDSIMSDIVKFLIIAAKCFLVFAFANIVYHIILWFLGGPFNVTWMLFWRVLFTMINWAVAVPFFFLHAVGLVSHFPMWFERYYYRRNFNEFAADYIKESNPALASSFGENFQKVDKELVSCTITPSEDRKTLQVKSIVAVKGSNKQGMVECTGHTKWKKYPFGSIEWRVDEAKEVNTAQQRFAVSEDNEERKTKEYRWRADYQKDHKYQQ